jgi:hypothetical protein
VELLAFKTADEAIGAISRALEGERAVVYDPKTCPMLKVVLSEPAGGSSEVVKSRREAIGRRSDQKLYVDRSSVMVLVYHLVLRDQPFWITPHGNQRCEVGASYLEKFH